MMSRRQKYVFDYLKQMKLYDPRRERSNSKTTLKLKGPFSLKQHMVCSEVRNKRLFFADSKVILRSTWSTSSKKNTSIVLGKSLVVLYSECWTFINMMCIYILFMLCFDHGLYFLKLRYSYLTACSHAIASRGQLRKMCHLSLSDIQWQR